MTKQIVVLTGAGISTSAGIPDFRGPDGVWTKHPDQMQVYDIDAFLTDKEAREYSWRWQKESPVWNAKPGKAHYALVDLEKAGMLSLIATQNFDALHEKAGNSPSKIVNLHGTIGTSHCMKCHAKYDTADIMARLDEEPDPHCHHQLPYRGNMPCNGLAQDGRRLLRRSAAGKARWNGLSAPHSRPTNCGWSGPRSKCSRRRRLFRPRRRRECRSPS